MKFDIEGFDWLIDSLEEDFEGYNFGSLWDRFEALERDDMTPEEREDALVRAAIELCSADAPKWEFIAARIRTFFFHSRLYAMMRNKGVETFYDKVKYLTGEGLYGDYILNDYSKDEIEEAAKFLDYSNDRLLTHSAVELLLDRYVIRDRSGNPVETVQEMFLGIALHLALNEPKAIRMSWVKMFYDMMARLEVMMATPTLNSARKPLPQLSSCFAEVVGDDLREIYSSLDNFAQVSKHGGGMALYFGKVRAAGASIRGFKGAAGGIVRWIRLANDTAVAVDQLGVRSGACAVYLDVWHKDIMSFLQLRTNNGDARLKAHDIFPAVCYPDLFWRKAEEDIEQDWHLFCPHEVREVMGFSLEDYWGEEWEKRYRQCIDARCLSRTVVKIKDVVRAVLKSAVETGTPFACFRDEANRMNPNGHAGMIYCSNLCTEIAQNVSLSEIAGHTIQYRAGLEGEKDTLVLGTEMHPGDFVVCNLASINLGAIDLDDRQKLESVVIKAVRALDNVIGENVYPVPQAAMTAKKYHAIGLGVSGWHHALAKRKIKWESEEHLRFADEIMEDINYFAIGASASLSIDRGSYPMFKGSDWETGAYFDKRGYTSERWRKLRERVKRHGMRNGYLLAVAPTSSISILAGTTAGVDPVMARSFLEEKKGAMITRVAPDLSDATRWYYKAAHAIEQKWSVEAAAARQRHIDQAQSFNLYITPDMTMRQLLELYLLAWRKGVKSIYYVRSKALEVEECESCAM